MAAKLSQITAEARDSIFRGMGMLIPLSLLVFILYPFFRVFLSSLGVPGPFTLQYYSQVFFSPKVILVWNTLLVSVPSSLLATALGLLLALLVVRSGLPGRGFFNLFAIFNIISPPFVSALSFIMLFGRRGLITRDLLGLDVQLFGWESIVVLQAFGHASVAYLVIATLLSRMDRELENAARDLGASESRVFFSVTLPLLTPGLTAAFVLSFTLSLADFGTPLLVGGGFRVLASEAYLQVIGQYNMALAAALCVLLLLPCLAVFRLEKLILGERSFLSEAPVQAIGSRKKEVSSRGFHPLVTALLLFIALLFIMFSLSIFLTIVTGAFTNIWGYDYTLSLKHFEAIWGQGLKSVRNSITFALWVALCGPMVGIVTAYYLAGRRGSAARFLEFTAILPFVIPGPFLGISYVLSFHRPPLVLTGTALIIILLCIFRELPISFKAAQAVLRQVSENLAMASLDLGANHRQTFTRIFLPLTAPAYRVGMIHAFIHVMTTIGAIIFLITPRYKVATFEIFDATNRGSLGQGAAFALLLIVLTVAGLVILNLAWKIPSFRHRHKERLQKWNFTWKTSKKATTAPGR